MKPASLAEIKKELSKQDSEQLLALCLRLARYKKESTELLTYLLFEADDEPGFIQGVKREIDEQFDGLAKEKNLYFLKKSIRRILRMTDRQIKYSRIKETEIELRIHFCTTLKASGIRFEKSPVLLNLYNNQLRKINLALAGLPEDLQYDYQQSVNNLAL